MMPPGQGSAFVDRLTGTLLGTALGDALGIAMEGLTPAVIARRFPEAGQRFYLLGRTGFVSDDTEQSALVAQCLARYPHDSQKCASAFRKALFAWFGRLPWGVGLATIRACGRIATGRQITGVQSAGNGAAMRSAIVGVFFADDPRLRHDFGRALAEVTHLDSRAIDAALYVAEVAAHLAGQHDASDGSVSPAGKACSRRQGLTRARQVISDTILGDAVDRAFDIADSEPDLYTAAKVLGTSGYAVHTAAFATYCFIRSGDDSLTDISAAIHAGGDTDSIAAIVGAWSGALHGERGLPTDLVRRMHDGPFGPTHLRRLGHSLATARSPEAVPVPQFSATAAMARNLSLYPVVLAHGLRRLIPL